MAQEEASVDAFEPSNEGVHCVERTRIQSTVIGLKAFWNWFTTPLGFLITIYGLNVVAWGGMLFLLLCGAAPAMCSQNTPANKYNGCNDIQSPRRKWIEIDSQILDALFCVTGFGLVPWRFRDLYWLLRYRCCSEQRYGRSAKMIGLRRLAGIHRGWFRLPGSDTLDRATAIQYARSSQEQDLKATMNTSARPLDVPEPTRAYDEDDERLTLPLGKQPNLPLTGMRAPPTAIWKLDFVVWCDVWNAFFQACLCGFMWGLNRYDRPSWSTGFFIAIACIVAGAGGIVMFKEGKEVKRVEGVPVKGIDSQADVEKGVELHDIQVEKAGSANRNEGEQP